MPFLNPISILAILIAISVHEWSHAITATKLGDPTPGDAGRLSLSPLAHLDAMGAILFLIVGFGWAKPVPINPSYFRHPKRGILLTAIAGPASNLIMACIAFAGLTALGLRGLALSSPWDLVGMHTTGSVAVAFFTQFFAASLFVNLGLMAFNLLPIAPLDGSNILQAFIPYRYTFQFETFRRIGPFILLGLFGAEILFGIPTLSLWIGTIMQGVIAAMRGVAGMFGL